MEIRKLRPEENVHRVLMGSICFGQSDAADRYAMLEKPEDHTDGYDEAWGAFDDDGRLISAMQVTPAQMMMYGKAVKVGLICGVTTLPEARNGRCVRKMFDIIMPLMRDEGMVFSVLYPFSFPFYRKFGYEHAYVRQRATFPIGELEKYPYPDGVKVHDKGGPYEDFAKVYEAFAKDKNLAMVRGKDEWEKLLKRDPHQNREFTYIHYNQAKEPDGYILYDRIAKGVEGPFLMKIRELAWTDKAGLYAMLGFIHGMRSEYEDISWAVPDGTDVFGLVESPWSVSISLDSMIMNRVMDVPAAISLMEAPLGAGSAVIGVTDAFMPENTGAYRIAWENGNLTVEKTTQAPDMEMDIETLAQLVIGFTTPTQASNRKAVTIHGNMDKLTALFPPRNLYLMEHF